jgi:hypothetical protein
MLTYADVCWRMLSHADVCKCDCTRCSPPTAEAMLRQKQQNAAAARALEDQEQEEEEPLGVC